MRVPRVLSRAVLVTAMLFSAAAVVLAGDPGIPIPGGSLTPQINDQTRGFILIYNFYSSSMPNPAVQNTRFSITNTNDQRAIAVHLYFVDGLSCSIADRYVCLTPNQTTVFLASDQDPGTTGYLVAVSTEDDGLPRFVNDLIGDAFVKLETGFFGNLGAEAIPFRNVVGVELRAQGSLAVLALVGLPRVLAVDSIGSRLDGNQTLLVINGVGGFFTGAATTIGSLFGLLFNDQEEAHSWNRSGGCQIATVLDDAFPRTTPRFNVVIPAGQTGWMKFWSTSPINNLGTFGVGGAADGRALLGAVFQRNPGAASSAGAFQGAHNLHKLNLVSVNPFANGVAAARSPGPVSAGIAQPPMGTEVTVFVFPVFPSNCGFVDDEGPPR